MNCKKSISRIFCHVVVILLCAMQGCTLSVPQANSVIGFVKSITPFEPGFTKEGPAVWLASVGDQGAILNPYKTSGLIVFANADGDAIAFDGWTVRSITGFGFSNPLTISGKDGLRTFSNKKVEFSTTCDAWVLTELTWNQSCGNGPGRIQLNEVDDIEQISMFLGSGLGVLTLRVAK
jgi:hypothetical protein